MHNMPGGRRQQIRLIDADAVKQFIYANGYVYANTLDKFPTIDPVKHGKWIVSCVKVQNMNIVRYRNTCSVCGKIADFLLRELHYNYCPYCGARMDGGK